MQTATVSWFPPPSVWNETCGFGWLEWTKRSEGVFKEIYRDARDGIGAPKTVREWRDRLRGHARMRAIIKHNTQRSQAFFS